MRALAPPHDPLRRGEAYRRGNTGSLVDAASTRNPERKKFPGGTNAFSRPTGFMGYPPFPLSSFASQGSTSLCVAVLPRESDLPECSGVFRRVGNFWHCKARRQRREDGPLMWAAHITLPAVCAAECSTHAEDWKARPESPEPRKHSSRHRTRIRQRGGHQRSADPHWVRRVSRSTLWTGAMSPSY